jgi:transaldolase
MHMETRVKTSPLRELHSLGQSIWVDFISRQAIDSGQVRRWIDADGVTGMTSNPSIFQKALAGKDYDKEIASLGALGKRPQEIYDALTVRDVQDAADLFRDVYDQTEGADGFVSLEVSPHLAHDTQGTVEQARRLWRALTRPNVFIKVPATREGLPAVTELISEGINVNVTLLFGLHRYEEVAHAFVQGLQARGARNGTLYNVASVASFFLSRIDTLLDPQLRGIAGSTGNGSDLARQLIGQVAILCAKVAYQTFKEIFGSVEYLPLADKGARPQRLLWASTSAKDPAYSDVKYVEALIGRETVNTLPIETLDAFRDHGKARPLLEAGTRDAANLLHRLGEIGIDLQGAADQLETEGVQKFVKAYDEAMEALTNKVQLLRSRKT